MNATKPPLSRPVLVASLPDEGLEVTVKTTAAERAALAAADGLVELVALDGRFTLTPERSGQGVTVLGEVHASVVQTCTVSLDPFPSELREKVDVLFVSESRAAEWAKTQKGDDEGEDDDPPDVIVDGRIDLGTLTAEFLALGLDPYPRKPGVTFESHDPADAADPSPFAALARLKLDP